jgi:hypothetical protein
MVGTGHSVAPPSLIVGGNRVDERDIVEEDAGFDSSIRLYWLAWSWSERSQGPDVRVLEATKGITLDSNKMHH